MYDLEAGFEQSATHLRHFGKLSPVFFVVAAHYTGN